MYATPTYLSRPQLEVLLGVCDETLRKWKLKSFLVPDKGSAYSVSSLNAFLAEHSQGFDSPPTVEDLLSGRIRLLKMAEVQKALGVGRCAVLELIRRGELAAVKLMVNWLISRASLEAQLQARRTDDVYARRVVAMILSVSLARVGLLAAEGKLSWRQGKTGGNNRPITRQSLLELLQELLPDWISAEDWLEDRLESGRPLLTHGQARWRLGVSKAGLWTLINLRQIQNIARLEGHGRLISPESVEAYQEYNAEVFTSSDVARLYGVVEPSVARWRDAGKIECPIDGHEHPNADWLLGSCWVAIMQRDSDPNFSATLWYGLRRSGRSVAPTLSVGRMAQRLGLEPSTVQTMADQGIIVGFRTPLGSWRFSRKMLSNIRPKYGQLRTKRPVT